MPDAPKHRVLVRTGERVEAASVVETFEYVDATPEQAIAYANGDPDWRSAKVAKPSWWGRGWSRVFGR